MPNSNTKNSNSTIKFLYSYGGKIVPRPTDGKLIYAGGFTRVLAVDRCITYAELMVKFGELCGSSVTLKCKLPEEDLDLLVTIGSDAELASVITEYDRVSKSTNKDLKIRVVLFPHQTLKKVSSTPSVCSASSPTFSPSKPPLYPRTLMAPPCRVSMYPYQLPVKMPVDSCRVSMYPYQLPVKMPVDSQKSQLRQCNSIRRWNQWL